MCNRSYGSAVLISMASYQGESCKTGMHSHPDEAMSSKEVVYGVLTLTAHGFEAAEHHRD
jgi:hypothetical protein